MLLYRLGFCGSVSSLSLVGQEICVQDSGQLIHSFSGLWEAVRLSLGVEVRGFPV